MRQTELFWLVIRVVFLVVVAGSVAAKLSVSLACLLFVIVINQEMILERLR